MRISVMCRSVIALAALFGSMLTAVQAASDQEIIDEVLLHVYEACYAEAAAIVIEDQGLSEFGVTVEDFISMMNTMNAEEIANAIQQAMPVIQELESVEQRLAFYEAAKKICIANQTGTTQGELGK